MISSRTKPTTFKISQISLSQKLMRFLIIMRQSEMSSKSSFQTTLRQMNLIRKFLILFLHLISMGKSKTMTQKTQRRNSSINKQNSWSSQNLSLLKQWKIFGKMLNSTTKRMISLKWLVSKSCHPNRLLRSSKNTLRSSRHRMPSNHWFQNRNSPENNFGNKAWNVTTEKSMKKKWESFIIERKICKLIKMKIKKKT